MTLREEVARRIMSARLERQRGGPERLTATDKACADAAIAIVKDRLTAEINEYPGTEYRRHLIMVRDVLLSTDKGDEG